jgi:opacity protein-like surface antigen
MTRDGRAAQSCGSAPVRALAILCIAVFALFVPGSARAADDEFARRGPYFALGASRAMNTFENTFEDAVPFPDVSVSDTWGLNARGGYRFAPWFSTELEYEFLDQFGVRTGGESVAELSTHTITVNAKFSLPAGRFQPYLLVGMGLIVPDIQSKSFIDFDTDAAAPAGKLGLGVDFYATPNVVLNLGFESVVNGVKVETHALGVEDHSHGLDYVALQFGLGFRF